MLYSCARARSRASPRASSIIYPRGYRPFLSSSARPLSSAPLAPLLRARHARSSSNARTRSRARTAAQAEVRAKSRSNVLARCPRGHSLLEGTFISLSRRVLVRIAPYFGSSRRHRRRRRRCTRAAARGRNFTMTRASTTRRDHPASVQYRGCGLTVEKEAKKVDRSACRFIPELGKFASPPGRLGYAAVVLHGLGEARRSRTAVGGGRSGRAINRGGA